VTFARTAWGETHLDALQHLAGAPWMPEEPEDGPARIVYHGFRDEQEAAEFFGGIVLGTQFLSKAGKGVALLCPHGPATIHMQVNPKSSLVNLELQVHESSKHRTWAKLRQLFKDHCLVFDELKEAPCVANHDDEEAN